MAAIGQLGWLFTLIGWTFGGIGVLAVLWALFWDRARGRRRCPRCWYDMAGVPGLKCPECGRVAKAERRLHRTRRRWRAVVVGALIGLVGFGVERWPRYSKGGWLNALPSWALILIAPARAPQSIDPRQIGAVTYAWAPGVALGPGPGPGAGAAPSMPPGTIVATPVPPPPSEPLAARLYRAAWSRLADGDMWKWEERLFLARCLASDPRLAPRTSFTVPERWALGDRVPVDVSMPLPPAFVLDVRFDDGTWTEIAAPAAGSISGRAWWPVRSATRVHPRLEFRIRAGKRSLYEGSVETMLVQQGTPEDFLDPIDTPVANARVASALAPRLVIVNGKPCVEFTDRTESEAWKAIDYAVFFTVELRVDARVVARGEDHAEWLKPAEKEVQRIPLEHIDGLPMKELAPGVATVDVGALLRDGAELVIRGDRRRASWFYRQRPFEAPSTVCWVGEAVVSVRQVEHIAASRPQAGER